MKDQTTFGYGRIPEMDTALVRCSMRLQTLWGSLGGVKSTYQRCAGSRQACKGQFGDIYVRGGKVRYGKQSEPWMQSEVEAQAYNGPEDACVSPPILFP